MERKRVLLGASGSVAAIRVPVLIEELKSINAEVRVLPTQRASFFLEKESTIPKDIKVYSDEQEWLEWNQLGDEILHIELRRWADALLIAPLSANTLAKLANGLCDNVLTSTARAWNPKEKPLIVAPAMNTAMWEHPITSAQCESLKSFGVHIIPPIAKKLACGDVGVGALASPQEIVEQVKLALSSCS